MKKFPKMDELKKEYATLLAENKKLYVGYKELKEKAQTLGVAKMNTRQMLGIKEPDKTKDKKAHDNRKR